MRLDKANLECARVAPKDEWLCIEPEVVVATDGCILAAVAVAEPDGCFQPVVISRESIEMIGKLIPKRAYGDAAMVSIDAAKASENGTVPCEVSGQVINLPKADAEFPNWRQVIPQGGVAFRVAIRAEQLMELAKLAAAVKKDGQYPYLLELSFFADGAGKPDNKSAIRVTSPATDRFAAVLMPCRVKGE